MENFNNNLNRQPLTKRERQLLKKQQREKERLLLARRKKIRKILFISLPILLLVVIIVFFAKSYTPEEIHPGEPKMEIPQKEYDAGTVSMTGGKIKYAYEIKNTGVGDLKIDSIWTSCHCTTAKLTVGDKTSPEFGMDKRSTLQKIPPGETGFLEITFDPAFHGSQGRGSALRVIYLSTNDLQNKKTEVRLIANVI